jgi:hypothetical protein
MMMVFGKKCPACGGQQLTARPLVAKFASLPTARAYACQDCRQQLVYLFPVSIGVENRQFSRKQLPPFFLVRIPGRANTQYARIKNISEGGLCFDQHYNAPPLTSHQLDLTLYNCNDGSSLEHLSTEIVATFEQLLEVNGIKTTVLNNCARFINLNQAQRKVLSTCLAQYGTT